MVDEVEIKNVGGRGVASEATLAALVSVLQGGNSTRERQARLEALARERNTRGLNEGGRQQGILTKTVGGTISAVGRLGKEFVAGGNRMGDFSQAVFGAESSITELVRSLDGLIDSYRELTSIGASFNNSIFEFMKSSAESGMSMGDFGNLISQNSTRLMVLGGTVSESSKRFGQISKIMRQDFGIALSKVGFTMSDLNDILLEYADFSVRSQGMETRSNKQLASAASEFGMQLDQVSRLTGIRRKQLAEEVAAQTQDQRVRSAMAAMNRDQAENFGIGLATAGKFSNNFKEALIDMSDTAPTENFTKGLFIASETFRKQAANIKDMDPTQQIQFMKQVAEESSDYMAQFGENYQNINSEIIRGAGDITAEMAGFLGMSDVDRDKLLAEQAAEDRVTAALLAFENALNNVKTYVLDQILLLGPDFSALANELFDLDGIVSETGTTLDTLKEFAKGLIDDGLALLKTEIQEFTAYLRDGGDPTEYLMSGLRNVADAVYNWFKDLFLGEEVMVGREDDRKLERQGGLFASMASAFEEFWEGPTGTALKDTIAGYFANLIKLMEDTFVNSPFVATFLGIERGDVATRQAEEALASRASGGTVTKMDAENALTEILGKGWLNTSNIGLLAGSQDLVDPAIISDLMKQINPDDFWTEGGAIQEALQVLGDKYAAGTASEEEQMLFEKAASAFVRAEEQFNTNTPAAQGPGFANGTNGFANFGSESMATLHGVEAVVPRNTLAGDLLTKTFGNDWNSPKANSTTSAPNQESVVKHINQLNSTMMMVLAEMKKSNELEKKTMNSVKGLNGDLYRGI